MKNILIFYTPGAYGSFVAWMIDRFNTNRRAHNPPVIDNPLQSNGSSHSYATLCKLAPLDEIHDFINNVDINAWGYRIWAGWPVTPAVSLDQAIERTLMALGPNDHLIVINRITEWEALLCWLNAGSKLESQRWFDSLGIDHHDQLLDALKSELDNRFFHRVADPRLLEISVNELLWAPPHRVLSLITELGLDICDADLFASVLAQQRQLQTNVDVLNNIHTAASTPAVDSVRKYHG